MDQTMNHTPEPWKYTSDKSGDERSNVWVTGSDEEQRCILSACSCCNGLCCGKADIERIIACVNACKGMDDPEAMIGNLVSLAANHHLFGYGLAAT